MTRATWLLNLASREREREKVHTSRGGMASGGQSRKLKDPISNHKHVAERVNWRWAESINS